MAAPDEEEKLLHSAAMQNANTILLARRRAEEMLARKTEELAYSLSLMRATLESTTDGILVTDDLGRMTDFNEKFGDMWGMSREMMWAAQHQPVQENLSSQLKTPEAFLATTRDIHASWPLQTFDVLELLDGRAFERYSKIQRVGERNVGRVWSFRDITQRKQAEEQLHQQQEWLRVTLTSIGDAVITTDTSGHVTFLNYVAERMTGWKSSEAGGKPLETVFNIINEETRQPAFNPVTQVLREGITVGLANHTALISRDGIETAIEDSAAPIKDAAGKIIGAVVVFHDVTERRKSELALRHNEALYRGIGESIDYGVWVCGPDGRNTYASESFLNLVGLTQAQCSNFGWGEVLHPDDAERTITAWKECVRTGGKWDIEHRFRGVDKQWHFILARGVPVKDERGQILCWAGINLDVSHRKRTEEALRKSEESFRAAFNQAAVGMATASLNGRFEQVNQRMAEILGYSVQELHERTFMELTHPDDRTQTQMEVQRLLAGEIPDYVLEKRYLRKDGRVVWSLTTVTLLKNVAGRPQRFIGIIEDITQRKQAEDSVRESAERLAIAWEAAEQANHAKDHFLAALSHELRTPLTPVLALLSNLCENPDLPQPVLHDLETMRRNVELEARLIDDLLDLTRVSRGKLELNLTRVPVSQLIEDAIETCLPDLKARRHTLIREIAEPQKMVLVDGARITQILWNLLKNSIKFTPEGGTITIRSRLQSGGGEDQVIIEVQDTGRGIEPEQLTRVFEAFEQGDRKITRQFGGLGLGLAISQAIAQSHHGTLTVMSAGAGRGSTFTLTLPSKAAAEIGTDSTRLAGENNLSGVTPLAAQMNRLLRILLVEDHADTAKTLSSLLERRGYTVNIASDVASALDLATRQSFDLLVSDLGLPDATGYELMSQIRERYGIPGIALSGYGMEEDVRKCLEAGFSGHLVKPVRISQLQEAIARIIPRS